MVPHNRSSRTVFLVNLTFVGVLVALLAVIALVVNPPAPPGIAAFAPQAQKQNDNAPEEQAAVEGRGPGACATGQVCAPPTPTPTATPTAVPTVQPTLEPPKGVPPAVACISWPDGSLTQTFDPQSPPCISEWPDADKGNGGATYTGVTATEIRVTMRSDAGAKASEFNYVNGLVKFINNSYQLYGRKLVLDFYYGPAATSPSLAHAGAQSALAEHPFAVITAFNEDSALNHELASNRTLNISPGTVNYATTSRLLADAPYSWTYEPPVDLAQRNLAAFTCSSLKPHTVPRFSPAAGTTRKYGIVVHESSQGGNVDPSPLVSGLRSCGITAKVYGIKPTEPDDPRRTTQDAVARAMQSDGVTTVLNLTECCNGDIENAAKNNAWHPEWVYYGKGRQYPHYAGLNKKDTQENSRIGLAPTSRQLPFGFYQQAVPDQYAFEPLYDSFMLLAAGIQMAGPNLTPQSFAAGLHATRFPNPGAGAAPYYQAQVGFPGSETWMIRDFAVWWPDVTRTQTNGDYALCFVDNGRRWSLDTWAKEDIEPKIKNQPC